jgi:predicted O-methyltransferase YrrM
MELKIVQGDEKPFEEFATIEEHKALGNWPHEFLSAYGMMPYLKRQTGPLYGVEIGVFTGENVRVLLDECPNIKHITGIDPYVEHSDQGVTRSQENMDRYKAIADKNLADAGDRYHLIQERSDVAYTKLNDEKLDFVLVDADHSYEGIMSDLRLYYPKLKSGGHMFIHDCYLECVRSAINDFREENKIRQPINMSKNFVHFWVKP